MRDCITRNIQVATFKIKCLDDKDAFVERTLKLTNLKKIDKQIQAYCKSQNLTYVRTLSESCLTSTYYMPISEFVEKAKVLEESSETEKENE